MPSTCTISDCGRALRGRGLCAMHWKRWKRNGDPLVVVRQVNPAEKRGFISAAVSSSSADCIDWRWGTQGDGYGKVCIDGRERLVTHVVLEQSGRPRPPAPRDMALHSCDRPSCINPGHLRWGTNGENLADKANRGRIRTGLANGGKLTDEMVRTIREQGQHTSQGALARRFGVSRSTVANVLNGVTYVGVG